MRRIARASPQWAFWILLRRNAVHRRCWVGDLSRSGVCVGKMGRCAALEFDRGSGVCESSEREREHDAFEREHDFEREPFFDPRRIARKRATPRPTAADTSLEQLSSEKKAF